MSLRAWIEDRYKKSWTLIVDLGEDPVTGRQDRRAKSIKKKDFPNKSDAKDELRRWQNEIESGFLVNRSNLTFAKYIEEWSANYCSTNLAKSTQVSYKNALDKHIIPLLGKIPLQKLSPMHLQSYYTIRLQGGRLDGREGGLSPTTVLYHHRIIHEALRHAVMWGLVHRNVAEAVKPPRKADYEPVSLTPDDVARIWAVADEPFKTIILIAFLTGMREGEIIGLHWEDFDGECLQVERAMEKLPKAAYNEKPPKRGSKRRITLPERLQEVLSSQKQPGATGLMFRGSRLGKPLNRGTLYHRFIRYAQAAGIQGARFHDLRHAHATMLMASDTNPRLVQQRLGHQSVQITLDTYSHVSPGMQDLVAKTIDRLIGQRFSNGFADSSKMVQ